MENTAGLLAKVLAGHPVDDALIDAMVLSAFADGVTREELDVLKAMVRTLPAEGATSSDDRIQASFARIDAEGLDGRLRALASEEVDDATRGRMFAAAAIIQYADGHVTNEENEFLFDLADVLELHEDRVRAIVEEIETALGVVQSVGRRTSR